MIRKLMRIGNSVGITLNKKMLREIGLDGETWLKIELDPKGKRVIIRKRNRSEW
ncbi:MAG: hypothetical protein Q8P20_10200 [bacterium]|nr:hypothetical protein [bacterium]